MEPIYTFYTHTTARIINFLDPGFKKHRFEKYRLGLNILERQLQKPQV